MIVSEISTGDLVLTMRRNLDLPLNDEPIDECLVASSIRRLCSFLCPCSSVTLVNETLKAFRFLIKDENLFKEEVEIIINRLIVGNDILEIGDVILNESNSKATWLFAASPAFLVRPNNTIMLSGIVADGNAPFPSLLSRMKYQGCKRTIVAHLNEDLVSTLEDYGLTMISESAWFKLPKKITASEYLEDLDKRLSNAEISENIADLMIIDSSLPNSHYKKRWQKPTAKTGKFVAKRPHAYGVDSWCYVELLNGQVSRFIDIPFKHNNIIQRGCDGAWQLQMAIDFVSGSSQKYNVCISEGDCILEFYSPIPLWAERRLIALGHSIKSNKCLFSYLLPPDELSSTEEFLKSYLWLEKIL